MKTPPRPWIYAGAAVALLLVGLMVCLVNLHWFRGPIENAIQGATGREARIAGTLRVWPLFPPRLVAGDVSLANASWSEEPHMFTARRLELRPLFWRLLRGQLAFRSIEAEGLRLRLERSAEQQGNWEFEEAEEPDPDAEASPILIRRLVLEDSELRFIEPSTQTALRLAATTDEPPQAGVNRLRLTGDGSYRDAPFSLEGRIDVPASIDADELSVDVQLAAEAGATRVQASGRLPAAVTTLGATLDVRLAGDDLGDLYELTGIALPETPPYDLGGELTWNRKTIEWQGFEGRIGDSNLQGDAALALGGKRPKLTAKLRSTLLDFDDLGALFGIPPATGEGETASPEQQQRKAELVARNRVLPDAALNFDKLNSLDADVTLEAEQIEAPKLPLRSLQTHVVLQDGVLKLDPFDFAAAGGTLATRLTFDASRQPIGYDFNIDVRQLKLAELVPNAESLRDAIGRLDGRIALQGAGDSIAAMFAGADGQMQVIMGRGEVSNLLLELAGLDVAEALKFLVGKDRKVAIRCAYADFKVQQGVATADALALDTEDTALLGRGAIDLRQERFDLTLLPRPKDRSPISLRSPLKVGGSFLDPSFAPDAGPLLLRGAAVAALAAIAPPAALLGLIETGPGENVTCGPGQRAGTAEDKPEAEEKRAPRGGPHPATR